MNSFPYAHVNTPSNTQIIRLHAIVAAAAMHYGATGGYSTWEESIRCNPFGFP